MQQGYQLLKIDEVWDFSEHTDGLFNDYVDTFLKIKQESSGFPAECDTDEKKAQYITDYATKEGIRLYPNQIIENPGLRALAKLMLNSFWGLVYYICNFKNPLNITLRTVAYIFFFLFLSF